MTYSTIKEMTVSALLKTKLGRLLSSHIHWSYNSGNENLKLQLGTANRRIEELAAKLDKMTSERDAMSKKLANLKYDNKHQADEQLHKIAALCQMSDDELEQHTGLDVREPDEDTKCWSVVTAYCQIGGCDMGIIELPSQRDALLLSTIAEAIDFRPSSGSACPECYADYMRDCI